MMGDLERYQQEFDTAIRPITARLMNYEKLVYEIRKILKDYFFDIKRVQKLSELAQENQVVFDFNQIKYSMEACLLDEQCIEVLNSAGYTSLVAAFDSHIVNSGLPIEIEKENNQYIFKPKKAYTPLAQTFMQQFAYALGIYRLSLGIYENYCNILNHPEIQQVQILKNYIDSALKAKEMLTKEETDLIILQREVRAVKHEILSQLKASKINNGTYTFRVDLNRNISELAELLKFGASYLQTCYKVFPNDPILWMLHDRSWHGLLKSISSLLYANYYTYSTFSSSLEIKQEFIGLIKKELENLDITASDKLSLLKTELLRKAAKLVYELKIDILAKLAVQGVELAEAPKVGLFSNASNFSIYHLMAELYRQPRQVTADESTQKHVASLGF
ncbi:hypothetical protein ACNVED_10740 [Legionella sp. D16C41]|uniref:hypothetical protein n=1 Tax=Legionella sp. D16C41 TaxID=3402688 RepID=UPI003AF646E8